MLSSVTRGFPETESSDQDFGRRQREWRKRPFLQIFIAFGSKAGRTVSLPLPEKHENMPLGELKRRIEPVTGLPPDMQTIFLAGVELGDDSRSLGRCCVVPGCTLIVQLPHPEQGLSADLIESSETRLPKVATRQKQRLKKPKVKMRRDGSLVLRDEDPYMPSYISHASMRLREVEQEEEREKRLQEIIDNQKKVWKSGGTQLVTPRERYGDERLPAVGKQSKGEASHIMKRKRQTHGGNVFEAENVIRDFKEKVERLREPWAK
jgi:hypothetical protein